jgi:hypothetical protein
MDKAGITENFPANMIFHAPCDMCPGLIGNVFVCTQQWIDKYVSEETIQDA